MASKEIKFAEEEVKDLTKAIRDNLKKIEKITEREQIRYNYLYTYASENYRKEYCCVCGNLLSSEYLEFKSFGKRMCKDHRKEVVESMDTDPNIPNTVVFECPQCMNFEETYEFPSKIYSVKPFKCPFCGYQCGVFYMKRYGTLFFIKNLPKELFDNAEEVPKEYV